MNHLFITSILLLLINSSHSFQFNSAGIHPPFSLANGRHLPKQASTSFLTTILNPPPILSASPHSSLHTLHLQITPSSPSPPTSTSNRQKSLLTTLTSLFPVWIILSAALGTFYPRTLLWFSKSDSVITYALSVIMISMGMTLSADDFKRVWKDPKVVLLGVACQFCLMPLSAWGVSRGFGLGEDLFLGMTLVGCSPGGTASNLITLIASADVPLSVCCTSLSTLFASILTPTLTKLICNSVVEVDGFKLCMATFKVVILPVVIGVLLNENIDQYTSKKISKYTPLLSVILVSLICGSVIASNSSMIIKSGRKLILAVTCLHSLGFMAGYVVPKLFGYNDKTARTISIETGMQNSALAVVLANSLNLPSAALPGAISATVHSCIGSGLAGFWRWRDNKVVEVDIKGGY